MIKKFAQGLSSIGVTANMVTLVGFLLNAAAGVMAAQGFWYASALCALGGGGCDLVDGTLARLRPDRSKFGALLDSSLDRYGDMLLIGGIGFFYAKQGNLVVLLAALSAMVGAFEISYVRARAEGLGFSCSVGFWERGERWVLLLVGLIAQHAATAVLVLAVVTHGTVLLRLGYIRCLASDRLDKSFMRTIVKPKWSRPINWLNAATALIFVLVFRWPF
jgi:CDP-diacylglycerol--glycerol-3-phosphate 3-phosphatidyltransferase